MGREVTVSLYIGGSMIERVFTFNPVRSDFIQKALDSLYKYNDMTNSRVIVVDQTEDGLKLSREQVHLVLRPHRNLGFAKSHNEATIHALHWGAKYIVNCNDDVEWINRKWWDGILETFDSDDNILAVNPECPRIPLWGYGRPHDQFIDIIDYKKEFTNEDYEFLLKGDFIHLEEKYGEFLPDTFPRHKEGVTDAVAMWMIIFKAESIEKIGLFDEKFYPGGAEDYDMDGRIYSEGYRTVGTTRSWVWHWWGKSKDKGSEFVGKGLPIEEKYNWADLNHLWPSEWNLSWDEKEGKMVPKPFDPWATCFKKDGTKVGMKRRSEIHVIDI